MSDPLVHSSSTNPTPEPAPELSWYQKLIGETLSNLSQRKEPSSEVFPPVVPEPPKESPEDVAVLKQTIADLVAKVEKLSEASVSTSAPVPAIAFPDVPTSADDPADQMEEYYKLYSRDQRKAAEYLQKNGKAIGTQLRKVLAA